MVDTRFHPYAGPKPLSVLLAGAGLVGAIEGDGPLIEGAEELHVAGAGEIALAAHRDYRDALRETRASAVLVSEALAGDVPEGVAAIVADHPHVVFVRILEQLYPNDTREPLSALLKPSETLPLIENDVRIGPGVVIGPGAEIGRGSIIGPNSVIGAGVTIGRNAVIGANVSIECAYLGNNVVLHSGARIGCEGFGWLDHGRSNTKIPQLGRAILQDRVEIGANTTVDRGALGDTVVGEGTKIDNLVQVGHNCRIGRNCLIPAHTVLAGSTVVGDSVMFGVSVATTGHLSIGTGSIVLARSVVTKDVPAGGRVSGYPARDVADWRRETGKLRLLSKGKKSGRED
jgi:UDP-3-O-[3-hydroxymyristoyl] glucosamine N-acyltransferase